MTVNCTVKEMQVCVLARAIQDGTVGVLPGVRNEVPTAAVALAAAIYAPNTHVHTVYGEIDARTIRLSHRGASMRADAVYQMHPLCELFDLLLRGDADWAFYGGLQIDQTGNLNLVGTGPWDAFTMRGPGTAGGASQIFVRQLFVWLHEHSVRVMVPQVDFVTVPGFGIDRKALQIPAARFGPIVTPKGVLGVSSEKPRMSLVSVHEGVSLDDLIESTGFDLDLSDFEGSTVPPTAEELEVLRRVVDPEGVLQ
jgi:glutaconate CoA-transferase subunit B